ncbi:unnamed protein product [Plutella xylostella]|uniref:(diamondback moth) hypothetical protein n=1 Tax=Plutella xylostella TaxID=51655 RepID=A0A8S4GF17_PLUXY|nr:unnamed protein product [Plutella xylostella]
MTIDGLKTPSACHHQSHGPITIEVGMGGLASSGKAGQWPRFLLSLVDRGGGRSAQRRLRRRGIHLGYEGKLFPLWKPRKSPPPAPPPAYETAPPLH